MKKITTLLLLISSILTVEGQHVETKMGPVIQNFGKVFQIKNPDLQLKNDKEYKVIFDIYSDRSKGEKINPLLNTVARFLNMHSQQGVSEKNMKVVVIMHGEATKNVLKNNAYQHQFHIDNPNLDLIKALKEAKVKLYVCGQSYLAQGFDLKDKSELIKLSLSALTALVKYQSDGYQLINFN